MYNIKHIILPYDPRDNFPPGIDSYAKVLKYKTYNYIEHKVWERIDVQIFCPVAEQMDHK